VRYLGYFYFFAWMCTKAKASWRDGLLVIDWFGTFSVLAVALILILGLDFGGAIFTWSSPKVISLVILGVLMMDFFLFTEKRLAKSADANERISMAIKYRCLHRRNNVRHCFYGSGILSASFLPKR